MKYEVTASQLENIVKKVIEYYENGDEIHVLNERTGKTQVYIVETKKVLTKRLNWDEKEMV